MEICEIQLYHLANKIKDTEVNNEVEAYLPAISKVFEGIDREELIKKVVSVEFTRFFNYYNKTRDLSSGGADREDRGDRSNNRSNSGEIPTEGSVRYFINVGEKDEYDWMSLKDFLRDTLEVGQDDIYKVDVKESFSFFNTDATITPKILETFKDFKVDGRFVNVEISSNPGGGGGARSGRDRNRGGGGGRDKNRSGGGGDFGKRKERSSSSSKGGYGGSEGGSKRRSGSGSSNSSSGSRSGNRDSSGGKSKRRSGFF